MESDPDSLKIQQYHESVKKARKALSKQMHDPHRSISHSFPSVEYKIKSVKLSKCGPYGDENKRVNGRRLYDITFAKKKHKERKGHPFRPLFGGIWNQTIPRELRN